MIQIKRDMMWQRGLWVPLCLFCVWGLFLNQTMGGVEVDDGSFLQAAPPDDRSQSSHTVRGWAFDSKTGLPVANCDLWLVRSQSNFPRYLHRSGEFSKFEHLTTTDTEGRFAFSDVSEGRWLVGPAHYPPGEPIITWSGVGLDFSVEMSIDQEAEAQGVHAYGDTEIEWAPLGFPIEVSSDAPPALIGLPLNRAEYVSGRLRSSGDPEKGPVDWTYGYVAVASQWYGSAPQTLIGEPDSKGLFRVGPFAPGDYRVTVFAHPGSGIAHAGWETVSTQLGESEVFLGEAGGVKGAVVSELPELRGGQLVAVLVRQEVWDDANLMTWFPPAGRARFLDVAPGTYVLKVVGGDGDNLIGISPRFVVTPGVDAETEVAMTAAQSVTVSMGLMHRYAALVKVASAETPDSVFMRFYLEPGGSKEFSVPSGGAILDVVRVDQNLISRLFVEAVDTDDLEQSVYITIP